MPRQKKIQEVDAETDENQSSEEISVLTEVVVEKPSELVVTEELQTLNEEEQKEREQLEKQIVDSFYQAGVALQELRDRKLFRSTHKTFEEYAKDILGYSRIRLYQLIGAAQVFKNIRENVNEPLTLLPTTEYQCRPLVKLNEKEQIAAWKIAIKEAGDKAPTSSAVKQAVLKIEQKATKKQPMPFTIDDIVRIRVKENPDLAGQGGHLALVKEIKSFNCTIETALGKRVVHHQHLEATGLKPEIENETRQLIHRLANLYEQRSDNPLVEYLLRYYALRDLLTENEEEILEVLEKQGKNTPEESHDEAEKDSPEI